MSYNNNRNQDSGFTRFLKYWFFPVFGATVAVAIVLGKLGYLTFLISE